MEFLKDFGLKDSEIKMFEEYANLLLEWNEKFNLTAITDLKEIELKHFVDSLYSMKFINYKDKNLIDVGSGAGFPGIPLAICNPKLNVTLLESNNKKCTFLNEVINRLNLKNVHVVCGRVEDLKDLAETYDIVTARAVKQLNILLEICSHLLKICGHFVAYKGSDGDNEIEQSKHAMKVLNYQLDQVYSYALPSIGDERKLIVLTKTKSTLKKYPRNYSLIVKNPL